MVCTANVCRSPYIAALLAAQLPHLVVASAGVAARPWQQIDPVVRDRLAALATPPATRGRSRRVTRSRVRRAGLILTAEAMHRALILELDPRAVGRTATLKELARLVEAAPTTRGLAAVTQLMAASHADTTDYDDDLADPHRGTPAAYARAFAEVEAAVAVIAPALGAARD